MNLVYFDHQLSDQAPGLIGSFRANPGAEWVTFAAIVDTLNQGEPVNIRPASPAERGRAESVIALSQIAEQLAAKVGTLLDADAPTDEAG